MNMLVNQLRKKFFLKDKWDHFSAIIFLAVPLFTGLTIIALISSDPANNKHAFFAEIQTTFISLWPISILFATLNLAASLLIAHCMGKAIALGPESPEGKTKDRIHQS
jgi:hypothetical protein